MKKFLACTVVFYFFTSSLYAAGAGSSQAFYQHWINENIPLIDLQQDINLTNTLGVPRSVDLTIDGLGHTLTLNNNTLIFLPNWNDGLNATIQNITINGASAGAVEFNGDGQNNHAYNVTNSTFTGNSFSSNGGAIYSHAQAQVAGSARTYTFTDNVFTYNSAQNGGALYNASNNSQLPVYFLITGGSFISNSAASGSGGAIYNVSNYGSGASLDNSFVIGSSLSPISFINNSAANGYGGAIYNFSNNPASSGISQFSINGTFSGNSAQNGGALVNQIEGGNGISTFTVTGSFTGNKALQNGGAAANYVGLSGNSPYGGAAVFDFSGVASFTNNTAASGSGGAIYNLVNRGQSVSYTNVGGTFSGNSARQNGGAIYNSANAANTPLNIADGSVFSNNKAIRGYAIYNDNFGHITINADSAGIKFTGNTNFNPFDSATNDIYQASANGIIDIITTGNGGQVYLDGGFAGLGTINMHGAKVAAGDLYLAASSDNLGFTGVFNQTFGITNVYGTMFGGTNNIQNTGSITVTDSVLNVYSNQNSVYYNANLYSNVELNHASLTSDIVTITQAAGDSAPGIQFNGSGAVALFSNGNTNGVMSKFLVQDRIGNGQSNQIGFFNSVVSFGTTDYVGTAGSADYGGLTRYIFDGSVIDLANSSLSTQQYKFGMIDVINSLTNNSYINIKAIGTGAAGPDNYTADSMSFDSSIPGRTLELGKIYISNDETYALSGTQQVLLNNSGTDDLQLYLGNDTYVVANSSTIYTLSLATTTTANDSIEFNSQSNVNPGFPDIGIPLIDLNDVTALTSVAVSTFNIGANRGWQIYSGRTYYDFDPDPNGSIVTTGLNDMASGTLNVYGSVQNDVTSVLSGKFVDIASGTYSGPRSLFNMVNASTTFNLSDLTIQDTYLGTDGGAVLRLNDAASTANLSWLLVQYSTSVGNGGAVNLTTGTLNMNFVNLSNNKSMAGNSQNGDGGAINVNGGVLNLSGYINSVPDSIVDGISGNSADGDGGAISISGGDVLIKNTYIGYNTAQNGGAISHTGGTLTLSSDWLFGTIFGTNEAVRNGGAIYNNTADFTINGNVGFLLNTAAEGGAIYNDASGVLTFDSTSGNIVFTQNTVTGGASNDIYNDGIINFTGNGNMVRIDGGISGSVGGAQISQSGGGAVILNYGSDSSGYLGTFTQSSGTVTNGGVFFGGASNISGGNLYWMNSSSGSASKTNTSSVNINSSASLFVQGGADFTLNNAADIIGQSAMIYLDADSTISVEASGAQLYLSTQDTWLGHIKMSNGTTTMDGLKNLYNSDYSQDGGTLVLINSVLTMGGKSVVTDGEISLDNSVIVTNGVGISLAGINGSGNLSMSNNSLVDGKNGVILIDYFAGSLYVNNSTANFTVDLDPKQKVSDQFVFGGTIDPGVINISDFGLLSAPADKEIPFQIFVASSITGITFATDKTQVQTAIGIYDFAPIAGQDGWYMLSLASLNPGTGGGQASVLAMLGARLLANNVLFDHVFFDSNQMLVREDKSDYRFLPSQFLKENRGKNYWVKSYYESEKLTTTSNMELKNDIYGAILGLDFRASDIGENSYFLPTLFAEYTGAAQTFAGATMRQNSAQAGFMASAMVNDVYTVSAMAYGGGYKNNIEIEGMGDDVYNWFVGAGVKNAYNMYFDNFILQPFAQISYNLFGKQKWDSSYGDIGMETEYLNGLNASPGANLIYGLETWNFLIGGSYVYNLGNKVEGKAGNIDLPELKTEIGYFEYTAGASKRFAERLNVWVKGVYKTNRDSDIGVRAGAGWRL
ncbi:MAG: hypothetical protein FWG57_03070 [Endomicrobia bacterium]|nr:hypothetical protein [Endomicrobiia bacterium]